MRQLKHSMARGNLYKSVWLVTNTTTTSKYMPKRTRICINWNLPLQTQIYLVKVPPNVNIMKQDLLNKNSVLKILWREIWKGDCNWDSGLLRYVLWFCGGICYQPDTFIQIGSGHTVQGDLITDFSLKSVQFFLLVLGVVFKSDL